MKNLSFKPFTWAKFTAIMCAVVVLINLFVLFTSKPFWMVNDLKDAEKTYSEAKTELKELEEKYGKALEKNAEEYNKKLAKKEQLQEEYNTAEENLDKKCSNSYYSYYSCRYNGCSSLHDAAEKAEEKYDEYLKNNGAFLEEYEAKLNKVESAKEAVAEGKEALQNYQKSFANALISFIATMIGSLALATFAFYLFTEKELKVLGLISIAAIALSDVLFLLLIKNVSLGYLFISIPFLELVIFGIFALIIWKEKDLDRKGLVALRVVTIILALLQLLLNPTYVLTTITIILISFVLVPINFKEYTKVSLHIFLSIVTLGIWLLVWFYHVTKNLNKVESMENRNPVNELLLCAFLPLYCIYWVLKNAEYIEAYAAENGKKFSISILCFLVAFVSPLLSTVFMQDKINEIVGKPE